MPDSPIPALTEEVLRRAVNQQIATEDARPEPLTAPAAAKKSGGRGSKLALLALLAGGAADMGSTIYGLNTGLMREANPLIGGMDPKIGLPVGAATEIGGVLLARKLLGKNHPKLLNVLTGALAGVHGGLAAHNLHEIGEARREANAPPAPNLVQHPDGSWYDPTVFLPPGR